MPKFRKRPVVIEAVQWDATKATMDIIKEWADAAPNGAGYRGRGLLAWDCDNGLVIVTLEGSMKADVGDWVIRGVSGVVYPCKPDIFEQTYDPVKEMPDLTGEPEVLSEDGRCVCPEFGVVCDHDDCKGPVSSNPRAGAGDE